MKKIIAFSGSNSKKSINQQLVHIASTYVEKAEVEVISLLDFPATMYGMDEEELNGFPDTMQSLHTIMGEADGFIISIPEHNGSMPAVFKNTIDWQSRLGRKIFNDKPTVFLSTSPGPRGGQSVLEHVMAVLPYQGALVIGGQPIGQFYEKVVDGDLVDGEDKTNLINLIGKLENNL